MKITEFTENEYVQRVINDLKKDIANKSFSDVLDDEGHQYVDFVQEGGGVLGIGLLGYTYVLEQIGIRFFSLAGTSAGAINTLLLASVDEINKPKTVLIIEHMVNQDLLEFVDGPMSVKKFFTAIKDNSSIVSKVWWGLWSLKYFFKHQGLNPGSKFREWIFNILKNHTINSSEDLENLRRIPKGLTIRKGINKTLKDLKPGLKIIAAEVTTESRIMFPEMNKLFWKEPDKISPAEYLRASMSIPLFFHPYKVRTGNKNKDEWHDLVRYEGDPPKESVFVDGGVLSNFPIDVFHNPKTTPRLPTFGVKLGDDRNKASETGSIPKFLMAIFNSARHVLDYQFMFKHKDYENLITKIETDNFNWLDFSIKNEDKISLFKKGAEAADKFLRKFNWDEYKKIRESLIQKQLED